MNAHMPDPHWSNDRSLIPFGFRNVSRRWENGFNVFSGAFPAHAGH